MVDELKGDFMKLVASLGVLLGFVVLFLMWSTLGTWVIVLVLALVVGGFFLFKRMRGA